MNSLIGNLLSIAGLTGHGFSGRSGLLQPARNSAQAFQDLSASGEVSDGDIWKAYGNATSRPKTLDESLRLWDEMCNWDLVAAALGEITDEATQSDPNSPALLWYETSDPATTDVLNDMLANIGAEQNIRSQVWYTAGFGNSFERLNYRRGEGVLGTAFVHPMDVRRFWLKKSRRCVGFKIIGETPDKGLLNDDQTTIPRSALSKSSTQAAEDLWYPWDLMHIRRMYRSRMTEHGEPLFEPAAGMYRKLRMALDMMTVHRAQLQPDRYVVSLDTKDLPPMEQMKAVERWKRQFRARTNFSGSDSPDGTPTEFKSVYNSMALDTVLWMAKPRDFGHTIEKLAGTASVPDVYDIELLTNLFFAVIGMPKSWIGLGDSGEGGPISGKALLAQDTRFKRKIVSIRQPVIDAYRWLGYFHLVLRNVDVSGLDIKVHMTPIGTLDDTIRIELLQKQAEVMSSLADVFDKFQLPREAWIDVVFRQYMHFPDDVVDAFMTSLPPERDPVALESATRASANATRRKVLEEIERKLGPERGNLRKTIGSILDGKKPVVRRRPIMPKDIFEGYRPVDNDLIVSSYGQLTPEVITTTSNSPATDTTQTFVNARRQVLESHARSTGRS